MVTSFRTLPSLDVTLATTVPVTTAGSGTTLTASSSQFKVVGSLAGYAVTAPATAFDGTAFNFTVAAVDANGSELLGATDPVVFSSYRQRRRAARAKQSDWTALGNILRHAEHVGGTDHCRNRRQ